MNEKVNQNDTTNVAAVTPVTPRFIGVIARWNGVYGFITPLNGTADRDLYFHLSSLVGLQPIEAGATVEYVLGEWRNRPCARMVVVIASAPASPAPATGATGGAR